VDDYEQTRVGAKAERHPHGEQDIEYRLTEAGNELGPIIDAFGVWGQRWAQRDLRPEEIDPNLLAWAMHRRLDLTEFPAHRAVLLFERPPRHEARSGSMRSRSHASCPT